MPGRESPVSALISCEHATNAVPSRWSSLFAGQRDLLESHRGWDPGSLDLARDLADALDAPLLVGRVTRLLVDLNRSAGHPRRLSNLTRTLPQADRQLLIDDWWAPYWQSFRETIEAQPGQVIHIACHSFTPVLDGQVRTTDIGLLYDPARPGERDFCRQLGAALRHRLPKLTVHMNRPYRGVSDGLGQYHRKIYDDRRLITFELEVNQRLVDGPDWDRVRAGIVGCVVDSMGRPHST